MANKKQKMVLPKLAGKKPRKSVKSKQPRPVGPDGKPLPRKYRHKPGTVSLRRIKVEQRSIDLIFPRAPFRRLVREIMEEFARSPLRSQAAALKVLQHGTEDILISWLALANDCAIHAKRVTVMPADTRIADKLVPRFNY
jgi:histone H3